MALSLGIENIGGPVVEGELEVIVAYRADGIDDVLTLSIPAADNIVHDFTVSVPPGVVRFDIQLEGESFPFDRVAKAADLEIVETDWLIVDDGQIAVDVTLRNTGNLDAEGVLVVGSAVLTDGSEAEGNGQTDSIPAGEERTVEVLIDVPAGEYVVQLRSLTASLEADLEDNTAAVHAVVTYVDISYDFVFTPGGYWSDGSANVELTATAINSGFSAFTDVAVVSYSCTGASFLDGVSTGKFEFVMRDGFSAATESLTLRSSPGTVQCRFISQEQGTQDYEHEVAAKIVGVSREVWECYSDQEINRHDDIGCMGHHYDRVAKWNLDRPMKVWATGDHRYIDALWAMLDKLSPLFDMTFTNSQSQDDADLKAWVGITRAEGPESLRSGVCVDADGCAFPNLTNDYEAYGASIGVWTVEADWYFETGLVDRRIEHVMVHELMHALMPMAHRDDPLSAVNIINAPDWIDLDPSEEALIRLHRNSLIRPGMTIEQVRPLIVLEDDLLDRPASRDESLTPMRMLRAAFRTLQDADSASFSIEGGWQENCDEHSFGRADYTIASFDSHGPDLTQFSDGSVRIYHFDDEDWLRESGEWLKDATNVWDETHWWPSRGEIHILLASAFYFALDRDIRVTSMSGGKTTLRFTLDNNIISKSDWYRSVTLTGIVTIDDRTFEITAYEMDWHYDTVRSNSCDRFLARATNGVYGVPIHVPDDVYFGTTDEVREAIDRINGPR